MTGGVHSNLARTIARMQSNAMHRRYGLWASLNIGAAAVSFGVLGFVIPQCMVLLGLPVFYSLNWLTSFEITFTVLLLLVQTYIDCSADIKRFGGTGIRRSTLGDVLRSFVRATVLSVVLGRGLLNFQGLTPRPSILPTDIFDGRFACSYIAAVASIAWLKFEPRPLWRLQDKPADLLKAFAKMALCALRLGIMRGVLIGLGVPSLFVLLRTAERVYVTWLCSTTSTDATPAVAGFCSALSDGTLSLPLYLPIASIWTDLCVSFVVASITTILASLMTDTLSYVTTYPLDFSKLQAKLVQQDPAAGAASSNNEYLLVRSLLIGAQASQGNSSGSDGDSGAEYSARTAALAVQEQQQRYQHLLSTLQSVRGHPALLPYFGEVPCKANKTAAVGGAKQATVHLNTLDLLSRSLAFQDLHRIAAAKTSSKRRKLVFAKHWAQVAQACCGMMDATSLQIQMVDAYIMGEGMSTQDPVAEIPAASTVTEVKKATSFENILQLRAQLHGNGSLTRSQQAPAAEVPEIEKAAPSTARSKIANSDPVSDLWKWVESQPLLGKFVDHLYLRVCGALQVPVPGRGIEHVGALPLRAFPPMCAATAVYAVEALSHLLVHALSEDATGVAQRSMASVLRCLLHLEDVVGKYCGTLQASQYVRISTMGRAQEIRYRARSENAVPEEIRNLQAAIRESIRRVVGAYRDELVLLISNYNSAATGAMFSRTQLLAIEAKLIDGSVAMSE